MKLRNSMRSIQVGFYKSISWLYFGMMLVIFAICVFCFQMYFGRSEFYQNYIPVFALLPFGIIFVAGLSCVAELAASRIARANRWMIIISVILLLTQVYALKCYFFSTDWDARTLIFLSHSVAHGEDLSIYKEYFSKYPNNLFLGWIFAMIYRVAHVIGFHAFEYVLVLCVQCALNVLTGFLFAKILKKLVSDNRFVVLGYAVYVLLIGMSPWVSIPYSDSMGLIFPVWILYIYLNRNKCRLVFLPWAAIGILSGFGYKIKPQIIIVLIAILIVTVLKKRQGLDWKKMLQCTAGAFGGIIVAILLAGAAVRSMNVPLDTEREFRMPHYFMMGQCPEGLGVWCPEDVGFSDSYATVKERDAADWERARLRIREMGVGGVINQFTRKTLTNYYDGTFGWSGEGTFFFEVRENTGSLGEQFFRGLYYTRDYASEGKYYTVWSNFVQMLWITCLLFSIFAAFSERTDEKNVVMLSIIGLSIFEVLFEARARYLYIYAPFYILLAVCGLAVIMNKKGKNSQEEQE